VCYGADLSRHRLAPISGGVEVEDANPLDTAWRELREETTLTPRSLALFRQGKPYSFVDESISREWTLNPFAFRLKSQAEGGLGEAGITIDWEHVGWEWVDPHKVTDGKSFGGVPRLTESLRRCWFEYDLGQEVGAVLSKGLDELRDDHESGARQLASKALKVLEEIAQQLPMEPREEWWKNLRMAAWHLWKNGRESMGAATLNAMLSALTLVERRLKNAPESSFSKPEELRNWVSNDLSSYAEERSHSVDGIWRLFKEFLEGIHAGVLEETTGTKPITILTLSLSSTTAACLKRAINEFPGLLNIRILESRPLFEGVTLASSLMAMNAIDLKANISLYTDASAAVAAQGIDLLLLGADLIDSDGSVSNKTGSLPAVLAAKHVSPSAKVIVLAEKEKVLPLGRPYHPELNDPAELLDTWLKSGCVEKAAESLQTAMKERVDTPGIEIRNIYFEWISPDLIDHYIFEDIRRGSGEIAEVAEAGKREFERVFGDL
jgi:translation initiation factor 2B subunit (eIF-2B alpha/beta/delta family)